MRPRSELRVIIKVNLHASRRPKTPNSKRRFNHPRHASSLPQPFLLTTLEIFLQISGPRRSHNYALIDCTDIADKWGRVSWFRLPNTTSRDPLNPAALRFRHETLLTPGNRDRGTQPAFFSGGPLTSIHRFGTCLEPAMMSIADPEIFLSRVYKCSNTDTSVSSVLFLLDSI